MDPSSAFMKLGSAFKPDPSSTTRSATTPVPPVDQLWGAFGVPQVAAGRAGQEEVEVADLVKVRGQGQRRVLHLNRILDT